MVLTKSKIEQLSNFDTDHHESKLGFSLDCLLAGAITLEEFKQWCFQVIESDTNPHVIFIELLDFDDSIPQMHSLFRDEGIRYPYVELSERQSTALTGISFMRNIRSHEDTPGEKTRSLQALKKEQEIVEFFQSEFSFIQL